MTSPPFSDEDANELFNRVVRHYELGLPRHFGLFFISKGEERLTLYRTMPPTRVIHPVVEHDLSTNVVILHKPEYCQEALDALRQIQVLDDMADLPEGEVRAMTHLD